MTSSCKIFFSISGQWERAQPIVCGAPPEMVVLDSKRNQTDYGVDPLNDKIAADVMFALDRPFN